jgi:hypothetical protein
MPITPTNTVSATTMAANWGPGVRNNAQKWLNKYLHPKRLFNADPTTAQNTWLTKINEAAAANSYANGMSNADVNKAADNAQQFGVTNFANAGTNKAYKYQQVSQNLANAINSALQAITSIPRGSSANNDQRMLTFIQTMRSFKGKIKA